MATIAPIAARARLAAILLALAAWTGIARGEIFVLEGQGEVRGQLVNQDQKPRTSYVVKTASGGQVTLDAAQVKEVKKQSAAEMKYDQVRGNVPDTVEGQWKLAEWCREKNLAQRKIHLERILELDPNHEGARHGLGYARIGGRWVTQEQTMVENGYVRSKQAPGKWVLPQEEELLEHQEKSTRAQLEWNAKLKRWNTWLGTDKGPQAVANIEAINDPFAVRGLAKFLNADDRRDVREMYVEALGRINTPAAMDVLILTSLDDADEEIRLEALDQIVSHNYKPAVEKFVQALKSKDNPVINRAAHALGQLKDPSAIAPLIDVLVTIHTFHIQQGQPGQTSAAFGTGANAGSFNFGGGSGAKVVKQQFENRDVLQALVDLTSGVSYNYDVQAWKNWYVAQKKPDTLDARRDAAK